MTVPQHPDEIHSDGLTKTRSVPRTMKASEFKAKCLELMDEVAESGDEIVITRNGRPTARLLPYRERFGDWFGADRDRIEIRGDTISPIAVDCEAESNPERVLNP